MHINSFRARVKRLGLRLDTERWFDKGKHEVIRVLREDDRVVMTILRQYVIAPTGFDVRCRVCWGDDTTGRYPVTGRQSLSGGRARTKDTADKVLTEFSKEVIPKALEQLERVYRKP